MFEDERGFFFESFNSHAFKTATGLECEFVQDNHSRSAKGVPRGLHYQLRHTQGKLLRVIAADVFDVGVDLRSSSPNFGKWAGVVLTAERKAQLWIPEGFAHGFVVLSENAEFLYKVTNYWDKDSERSVLWNDPDIGIAWPIEALPLLSDRDRYGTPLQNAEVFA